VAHDRAVDRAGTGSLTAPQFRRFCRRLNPGAMSDAEISELFRELCPGPGRYQAAGAGAEQRVTFSMIASSLLQAVADADEGAAAGGGGTSGSASGSGSGPGL
jgi:hypothetical protein